MQILSKTSLAAALCAAFALTSAALPVQAAESTPAQQQTQGQLPDFVKLVEDNGAGVVNISVTKKCSYRRRAKFRFPRHG